MGRRCLTPPFLTCTVSQILPVRFGSRDHRRDRRLAADWWVRSVHRRSRRLQTPLGGHLLRILALPALTAITLVLVSLGPAPLPERADTSEAALTTLGQEYDQLRLWASAIVATTDTLNSGQSERARALADQLARVLGPLEGDFEKTTAALSTSQLDMVLPLWERMAFAHAGLVMLQEKAASLGDDPAIQPAELYQLATELSAVLDLATETQRMILSELTDPPATPIRIT
jgi:hypothetical protein